MLIAVLIYNLRDILQIFQFTCSTECTFIFFFYIAGNVMPPGPPGMDDGKFNCLRDIIMPEIGSLPCVNN